MNQRQIDLISFIAFISILIGGGLLTYYYIVYNINSCTSDPLKYSLTRLQDSENYSYVKIYFYQNYYDEVAVKQYEFNLTNPKK